MAAANFLGATWNTTAGSKSCSGTPSVNTLLIVVTAHSGNTDNSVSPPTDNQGGTYSLLASALKNGAADILCIWARNSLVASAVSHTITHNPNGGTTGGGLVLYSASGMTRTGSSAARQIGVQALAAAGTPSVTMAGGAILTGNPVIGAVFNGTNSSTTTAPSTGWTEDLDSGYGTPTSGLESERRSSGETASTISWTAASASAYCAAIVELDTSAASNVYNDTLSESAAAGAGFVTTMVTVNAIGESAAALDILSGALVTAGSLNEATAAADSAAPVATFGPSVGESAAASDALGGQAEIVSALAEGTAAGDALVGNADYSSLLAAPVLAADAVGSVVTVTAGIAEAAVGADDYAAVAAMPTAIGEQASAAILFTAAQTAEAAASEILTAGDDFTATAVMDEALAEAAGAGLIAVPALMVSAVTNEALAAGAAVAAVTIPALRPPTMANHIVRPRQRAHSIIIAAAARAAAAHTGIMTVRPPKRGAGGA